MWEFGMFRAEQIVPAFAILCSSKNRYTLDSFLVSPMLCNLSIMSFILLHGCSRKYLSITIYVYLL